MNKKLTDAQFQQADQAVLAAVRSTGRGTPERAAADALYAGWDAVCTLPSVKLADREVKFAAIAKFAVDNRLVTV